MPTTHASVLLNRLQARGRMRHLQVLVKLAEAGSLKRASEAMHLSQPAVSQLLADLERLVELPLFERHARGVRLAPAGRELLPLARRMLDALAEGSDVLTTMKHQGDGTLRISAIAGSIGGLLAHALPGFARAHPAIQVYVRECDIEQWSLHLMRGEADVAGCRASAVAPAGFSFLPLLTDRFVVACSPDHPLASHTHVPWSVLARQVWLPSPVGSAARQAFDDAMARVGGAPRLSTVVARVAAVTWAMLRAEQLLTLVPYGVVRQLVAAGQLAVIVPKPQLPFSAIGLMVPQQVSTVAVRSFIDFMQDFARDEAAAPPGAAGTDDLGPAP